MNILLFERWVEIGMDVVRELSAVGLCLYIAYFVLWAICARFIVSVFMWMLRPSIKANKR